jgi:osmotically-inducible protein OsmY
MRLFIGVLFSGFLMGNALGQNPLSLLGRAVTTTMDVRTKAEVTADTEISAGASKRLLDDKKAEWAGVTLLVFAQHVVLAGAVKTDAVKKRVEELVRQDKRIRSFRNELLVGDVGALARDTALEAEINATLTAAKGISSVNMRWCATGGRVVLMGIAESQHETTLAQQKIRGIKGVKALVSHLRVVPPKK